MPERAPVIPDYITVHLGPPDADAPNVTLSFFNYIKNITSSGMYPTLPESALIANIYARISYALNRIYSQDYRGRGYNFDITNSPPDDITFVPGNKIYKNINQIVDETFNDYIVRGAINQPIPAQYCNVGDNLCEGLSIWESVNLAESGYTPYQILQYFYGNDIGIVKNAPIASGIEPYPGIPLSLGSWSNDVFRIQTYLNRISQNYPAIPMIPLGAGIYDEATMSAVKKFQEIANLRTDGIVDKATWYILQFAYTAVTRLDELFLQGYRYTGIEVPYKKEYKVGDSDDFVNVLLFYLNFIAQFDNTIPSVEIGRVFSPQTRAAVMAFQRKYGLPVTGTVDSNTWNGIQQVYRNILASFSEPITAEQYQYYPGYFITTGAKPDIVKQLQTYLRVIAQNDKSIPPVNVTGVYGPETKAAVTAFQKKAGTTQTGYVDPLTWLAIVKQYNEIKKIQR